MVLHTRAKGKLRLQTQEKFVQIRDEEDRPICTAPVPRRDDLAEMVRRYNLHEPSQNDSQNENSLNLREVEPA